MRLIAPPLPAASRPSKTTTSLSPSARTYSCMITSWRWSFSSSFSNVLRGSLPPPLPATLGRDVDVPGDAPGDRGAGLGGRADAPPVDAGLDGLAEVRLAAPVEVMGAGANVAEPDVLDRLGGERLLVRDPQDHLVARAL